MLSKKKKKKGRLLEIYRLTNSVELFQTLPQAHVGCVTNKGVLCTQKKKKKKKKGGSTQHPLYKPTTATGVHMRTQSHTQHKTLNKTHSRTRCHGSIPRTGATMILLVKLLKFPEHFKTLLKRPPWNQERSNFKKKNQEKNETERGKGHVELGLKYFSMTMG